jgi:hypothetical protein
MTDVNRPLTIKLAAALSAFTPGELSAAIQRKELKGWKQAGKIRTTLADIDEWTERCRVGNHHPGSISTPSVASGSSEMAVRSSGQGLQRMIEQARSGDWDNISDLSTGRRRVQTR